MHLTRVYTKSQTLELNCRECIQDKMDLVSHNISNRIAVIIILLTAILVAISIMIYLKAESKL